MRESHDIRKAYADDRAEWRFAYYYPGERMTPHRHDCAQFSFVMTGAQREISNGAAIDSSGMSMALKPANFRHEAEFGDHGALLLSINLYACDEDDRELRFDRWRVRGSEIVTHEWAALVNTLRMASPDAALLNDITDDLLTVMVEDDAPVKRAAAPSWLLRARDAVMETDMDAADIAKDAGVHRVHFSRSFRRYFGMSVTEQRRRARLARAAMVMIRDGARPAAASATAGFSDQAHFTRDMRRQTGLTPGALARIFHA